MVIMDKDGCVMYEFLHKLIAIKMLGKFRIIHV